MRIHRYLAASAFSALVMTGQPANAASLFDSGPIADFMNIFREQAIPRETVAWKGAEKPGTIVVSTSQRRLYYVLGGGAAVRYGVGVGRHRQILRPAHRGQESAEPGAGLYGLEVREPAVAVVFGIDRPRVGHLAARMSRRTIV